MHPVTERDIRSSFLNCSQGQARRLPVPRDLDAVAWDDLDFLGWRDGSATGRCYLVVPEADGDGDERVVGVLLRHGTGGHRRTQMCAFCLTTHGPGGVALVAAPKAGEAGRRGNTVGTYVCADLACSLYARELRVPSVGRRYREDLSVDERVARVRENVAAFVGRVRD